MGWENPSSDGTHTQEVRTNPLPLPLPHLGRRTVDYTAPYLHLLQARLTQPQLSGTNLLLPVYAEAFNVRAHPLRQPVQHTQGHTHTHTYIHTDARTCAHTHARLMPPVHTWTSRPSQPTNTHARTNTRAHTHTHTHTHWCTVDAPKCVPGPARLQPGHKVCCRQHE